MRIDQESQANAHSRTALLAFLPQLTAIIRVSDDMLYKQIAVGCVDKIAEKYGKKDPEAVTAAAATIAGNQCLGQDDERLRVMALLCLASLVDVLQDGVVPVLPSAIPKTLSYITESLQASNPHAELHNAGYAFLTALAQHLPYILSGSYLQQLLAVSSVSAKSNLSTEANDSRLQCLNFLAKQIDAKVMFTALEQNWSTASGSGFTVGFLAMHITMQTAKKYANKCIPRLHASILTLLALPSTSTRRTSSRRTSPPYLPSSSTCSICADRSASKRTPGAARP